jgi:hypothetical protein
VNFEERAKTTERTSSIETGDQDPRAPDYCAQTATSEKVIVPSMEIASILENAEQTPGRRERILDLLCRFRVPASGIALPFFANKLLASLRLAVANRTIDETQLQPVLDDYVNIYRIADAKITDNCGKCSWQLLNLLRILYQGGRDPISQPYAVSAKNSHHF